MTGVDSLAAQYGGACIAVENFLFTVESFKEYFDMLKDDGILCITNISFADRPVNLRICTIAVEAFKQMGIEHPERNVIVINQGMVTTKLIKKSAFTQEEIDTVLENLEKRPLQVDPAPFFKKWYDPKFEEKRKVIYRPGLESASGNDTQRYFMAVTEGKEQAYIDNHNYDVRPPTDNQPFFHVLERWNSPKPTGFVLLGLQFIWISLLAIVLILLPLFVLRRKGLLVSESKAYMVYFACLGLAFILIEIGFMQKFTLFLGHPSYYISVVLFALLVFSGLGSLVSGRFSEKPRTVVLTSILCITGIAIIFQFALDPLFHSCLKLPLTTRIIIAIITVSPLAFFMGMPFPTGLKVPENQSLEFVPWAWAINGSALVVATFLSTFIAPGYGFPTLVLCALIIYLLAMLMMVSPRIGMIRT